MERLPLKNYFKKKNRGHLLLKRDRKSTPDFLKTIVPILYQIIIFFIKQGCFNLVVLRYSTKRTGKIIKTQKG